MKNTVKNIKRLCLLVLILGLSSTAQEIKWHSIDAGGGVSTNIDGTQLLGVIGQADTIRMTGGNISLSGGYLPLPVKPDPIFQDSFE